MRIKLGVCSHLVPHEDPMHIALYAYTTYAACLAPHTSHLCMSASSAYTRKIAFSRHTPHHSAGCCSFTQPERAAKGPRGFGGLPHPSSMTADSFGPLFFVAPWPKWSVAQTHSRMTDPSWKMYGRLFDVIDIAAKESVEQTAV